MEAPILPRHLHRYFGAVCLEMSSPLSFIFVARERCVSTTAFETKRIKQNNHARVVLRSMRLERRLPAVLLLTHSGTHGPGASEKVAVWGLRLGYLTLCILVIVVIIIIIVIA